MCPECKKLRDKCLSVSEQLTSAMLAAEISKVHPNLANGPVKSDVAALQSKKRIWLYRMRQHLRLHKQKLEGAPELPLSIN